jgi:hypothetical protein
MENVIYWNQFDAPQRYISKFKGKEIEAWKEGEFVCTDERVDRVWFTGGEAFSSEKRFTMYVHILFKDGSRHEKELTTTDNIEDEATEFLQSIK